jgi:4-alpha-glucanotransferase
MSLSDALTRMLARRVGVSPSWTDWDGSRKSASLDTLRGVLNALGYPCGGDAETRNTLAALDAGVAAASQARFVTARVGQPLLLPPGLGRSERLEVEYEDGGRLAVEAVEGPEGALTLPALRRPGYHRIRGASDEVTVATAPERCVAFRDLSGGAAGWGLAAQIYSLPAGIECGVGDFGGVAAMARASAARGADLLAISPCHALLGVAERFDSPYSPSSRQFFDPVYADLELAFDPVLARAAAAAADLGGQPRDHVDWRTARAGKTRMLQAAYDALIRSQSPLRGEFERFRDSASPALRRHALFEAIREAKAPEWDWRKWPAQLRSPQAEGARSFAGERGEAVTQRIFLQWLTQRSLAAAHEVGKRAGMRVGLIADIATGLDPAGSDAWARPDALLQGLTLGAPPDPYTPPGQDWKLTSFSPRGLAATGYQAFIDMLRACLAHVGGIRLDHAMGMQRLWLIPEGMGPQQGTYVAYPAETLFRLIALESWRRRAVVIGEDLGTFPSGFREYLAEQGVSGMRLLRIQRERDGLWKPPAKWTPSAAALTVTHDIMATAGWWKGAEIEDGDAAQETRAGERELIWKAFCAAGVAEGDPPPPQQAEKSVDAAIGFVAATPCQIKLVSLEDALATEIQPNVPGTTTQKPNWRHRYTESAETLLSRPGVAARLGKLSRGSV